MVTSLVKLSVKTHIGAISDPWHIRLPVANQMEFDILNWLIRYSGSSMQGYGLVHSSGQSLPMTNNEKATRKKATARAIQTSIANGSAKEKKLGGAVKGFLNRMLIPNKKKKLNKQNENILRSYLMYPYYGRWCMPRCLVINIHIF